MRYFPKFRTKPNGVPILSKLEIDDIAENCLREFCPSALITAQPIDEDRFLVEYLDLEQDFQFLTHCGAYLGMIVFNNTNKIIIYNPNANRAEYITAKKGTVIIDNTLLAEGQEHRYRFTVIHEGGHWLLHRKIFCNNLGQAYLSEFKTEANVRCRAAAIDGKEKSIDSWNDDDTLEWQANYFSSAILMPKKMILKVFNENVLTDKAMLSCIKNVNFYNYILTAEVSKVFNVSFKAAEVRLKNLNLLRK